MWNINNLDNGQAKDPLIPYNFDSPEFVQTVTDTFEVEGDVVDEINIAERFNRAIANVEKYEPPKYQVRSSLDKRKKFRRFTVDGKAYHLLEKTYKKMVKRFVGKRVNVYVVCLLIRYSALDTAGHQWAMPGKIKDMFPINFEMFASSFNCHYKYYCSMFYDLEWAFGSLGRFQDVNYIRGTYMANPPYEVNALKKMIETIIKSVRSAKKEGKCVAFVFGLPAWDEFDVDEIKKMAVLVREIPAGGVPWVDHMFGEARRTPGNSRFVVASQPIDVAKINRAITTWTKSK